MIKNYTFDKVKNIDITSHNNLMLAFLTSKRVGMDAITIGDQLTELGCDAMNDGGFWIWDIIKNVEYYSQKFRASLGYKGVEDFPNTPKSWQDRLSQGDLNMAINNYDKCLQSGGKHPYSQTLDYNTKYNKNVVTVSCTGTIVKDKQGVPIMLVGSHKLVKK